jgi:hypothetical protein
MLLLAAKAPLIGAGPTLLFHVPGQDLLVYLGFRGAGNPRPYVWTKTSDHILESIAEAGHIPAEVLERMCCTSAHSS